MNVQNLIPVGQYIEKFNTVTGQALPCGVIYRSSGLLAHIKRRHPELLHRFHDIPAVIEAPDYIVSNPKEPNSIELVKQLDGNVMVCVKLDMDDDYLYVATVFEITDAKLQHRIKSGRLKTVDFC